MKTKIFISVLLLLLTIIFSFKNSEHVTYSGTEILPPQQKLFIVGAMHDAMDHNYQYISSELGLNMFHQYTSENGGWHQNNGTPIPEDKLGGNTSVYGQYVRNKIASNEQNNLMTLMDRPVTSYLCFGQGSDYQVEDSNLVDPDYIFYTYRHSSDNNNTIKDIPDNTQYGNGQYVKQCLYDRVSPGTHPDTIVKGLKTNREQVNNFFGGGYVVGDSAFNWYIMPRIKLDSVFANNSLNQDKEVCKIITSNWDGEIKEQVLKVKNFKPSLSSIYKGNYIEIYFPYSDALIENLKIEHGTNWFNNDSTRDIWLDQDNKVDFKVLWYDKCDMWIDYIRVENDPARDLITLPNQDFIDQLMYEVKDIAMNMINSGDPNSPYKPYKFYIEEFEFNHLPSIGYVNKMIIDSSQGKLSLMVNCNYDMINRILVDRNQHFTAQQMKKYLIDKAKVREIFTHSYALEGWETGGLGNRSFNPPTLHYSGDYDTSKVAPRLTRRVIPRNILNRFL